MKNGMVVMVFGIGWFGFEIVVVVGVFVGNFDVGLVVLVDVSEDVVEKVCYLVDLGVVEFIVVDVDDDFYVEIVFYFDGYYVWVCIVGDYINVFFVSCDDEVFESKECLVVGYVFLMVVFF